ncbi:hypothetical protein PHLGIDRAFT_477118 [Phlebiopsis gigantea 11061_1 CR5-6]|uniref:Uncharacterized protein n=1 Tax=Phlebiopsis gigantea (strain 11061_1 CR5-6) TaxID=745531 RepID=A0A0C3PIY7_PHLG1|nr:hypothetical protein PHLGIDRAFT_477118 [Phlebiopsis gigantea 11061_1 CR5-6]
MHVYKKKKNFVCERVAGAPRHGWGCPTVRQGAARGANATRPSGPTRGARPRSTSAMTARAPGHRRAGRGVITAPFGLRMHAMAAATERRHIRPYPDGRTYGINDDVRAIFRAGSRAAVGIMNPRPPNRRWPRRERWSHAAPL